MPHRLRRYSLTFAASSGVSRHGVTGMNSPMFGSPHSGHSRVPAETSDGPVTFSVDWLTRTSQHWMT